MELDAMTIALGLLALCLVWTTWQARRMDNERRDVVALGCSAGAAGLSPLVAAMV